MRTTIRLDDTLLREAKAKAARAGRSLNEFIEDAVRVAVLTEEPDAAPPPLPSLRGSGGLLPGVSIDSFAKLLDLMEDDLSVDRRR